MGPGSSGGRMPCADRSGAKTRTMGSGHDFGTIKRKPLIKNRDNFTVRKRKMGRNSSGGRVFCADRSGAKT